MHRHALRIDPFDHAIHPVAAAGVRLDAQQADGSAGHQRRVQGIVRQGGGADMHRRIIRRADESGWIGQHRCPRLPLRIERAQYHKRQLREEVAMLVGHAVADHLPAGARELVAHAQPVLQRAFAGVKRRRAVVGIGGHRGYAASPTTDLLIGTKRGKASIRASQARRCGYGCRETLPSGAWAM